MVALTVPRVAPWAIVFRSVGALFGNLLESHSNLPLVDNALAVQVQRRDGGAANRGEANHHCGIIAPGRVSL